MNFADAEKYLISLGNEVETMKLGLDNIRTLLDALGNPQTQYLKVQVAGTNGKGSVCAFLDSICREAGIRTGLFTSPHLISITERIKISGVDIGEDEFADLATRIRETSEKLVAEGRLATVPTYFEQVTAMALLAFAENRVELAILETGMGGRYDATTAANAEICAITRIDLDHQRYLGDTIEEIAAEKAAIIRADSESVVIGDQLPAVLAVINERLRETEDGNPTSREGAQVDRDVRNAHLLPLVFPPSTLGLKGEHQVENAQIAVAVADRLRSKFLISDDHILVGLKNARHPGRLEYQGRYLFDGAHNIGGAKALRAYLDNFETRPITLVFGAVKDKEVGEIAEQLFPMADRILFVHSFSPRALRAAELLQACPRHLWNTKPTDIAEPSTLLAKIHAMAFPDGIVLITGSLYLVGEAKRILNSQI